MDEVGVGARQKIPVVPRARGFVFRLGVVREVVVIALQDVQTIYLDNAPFVRDAEIVQKLFGGGEFFKRFVQGQVVHDVSPSSVQAAKGAGGRMVGVLPYKAMSRCAALCWSSSQNRSRSAGSGVRLARAASEISVGALVRLSEADSPMVECFDREHSTCSIGAVCRLKGILNEAMQALYAVLDSKVLSTSVENFCSRLFTNL